MSSSALSERTGALIALPASPVKYRPAPPKLGASLMVIAAVDKTLEIFSKYRDPEDGVG